MQRKVVSAASPYPKPMREIKRSSPSPTQHANHLAAVDLFCGAGGLTKGLELAGVDVRLGIDIDTACAFPYEANNRARYLLSPVEDTKADIVRCAMQDAPLRLIAGCAPCQPFSTYSQGRPASGDGRWSLLGQFLRLVRETIPEYITMENVPRLEHQAIFANVVWDLRKLGYYVQYGVLNCLDYGVPQQRRRLVLLGSRLAPIQLPGSKSTDVPHRTVRDTIGHLPPLLAGGVDPKDPLHQCASLSPTNLARMRASRPGGSWRDWDSDLIAHCHRQKTGKTFRSVYGRMVWDSPAPTLTTQFYGFGSGRFGHPEQDRAVSLREGALLQSFPIDYQFAPPEQPVLRKTVGRLIGNAVPVKLGKVIGATIMAHAAIHA